MAGETYLTLVNSVLKRLRENTVTTVEANILSSLVGEFVNEAKSLVERAHGWKALETTLTVLTADTQETYSLTGAGNDPEFLYTYNNTQNTPLKQISHEQMLYRKTTAAPVSGPPYNFSISGVDSNGDHQVELYPIPNGVQTLTFRVSRVTPDLSDENDVILVPQRPIVQLATAMSIAERGEEGSISAVEQIALADRFVSDYVATQANTEHGKYDWRSE